MAILKKSLSFLVFEKSKTFMSSIISAKYSETEVERTA